MTGKSKPPATIDEYIKAFEPPVQAILARIRRTVKAAAPDAAELVSYRMPAFKLHGILVYFAGFKNHIGLYPPVRDDPKLIQAAAPYAGGKGNLRFPLDQPIPYDLIKKIVLHRVKQNLAKVPAMAQGSDAGPGKRPARRGMWPPR